MKKLKKISLKKEVVDRLNSNQMEHLRGGNINSHACNGGGYSYGNTSDVSCPNTCGTSWTCNG
ncbi:MAG: TIGR04149 family rSAM-modified RiPP [Tannerellaceae bacterium]|nr:TIGR04149 family rSAM-modified RiPP [Tannerellaceae bacterium]